MMGKQKTKKTATKKPNFWQCLGRPWRWVCLIVAGLFLLIVIVWTVAKVSPWPNALLIRHEFNRGGTKMSRALEKHLPNNVTQVLNQHYRSGDNDAFLDV